MTEQDDSGSAVKCNFIGIDSVDGIDEHGHTVYGPPFCKLTYNEFCVGKDCIFQRILTLGQPYEIQKEKGVSHLKSLL